MSKENLIKLLETAAADEQLMQQLQNTSSYEEVKNLARQQGFDLGDLSAEEAERAIDVMTGAVTEELSDEELEMVAGGFSLNFEKVKVTFKGIEGVSTHCLGSSR